MQELAKAELEIILSSAAFSRSQRMASLLRYLCAKYFAGESEQVKEYNIAVEVFGRPDTFDPVDDAIARVEVHRLRKRLREYYEKDGASHEIRLEIPTGSYVPSFVPAGKPALTQAVVAADPPSLSPAPVPAIPVPVAPAAPAMLPRPFSWLSTVLVAAVVVLIFVEITFHFRPQAMSANASPTMGMVRSVDRDPQPQPDTGMAGLTGHAVRIAAGQTVAFRDHLGRTWEPDEFFSGGDAYRRPAPTLARTGDPGLFEKGRSGRFGYDIPLQPGNYELHLFFAETEYGPGYPKKGGDGSRVFHVSCNGQRILSEFDVLADAGGPAIVDERVFRDVAPGPDGRVHLRFIANMGEALVNAIELVPARAPPVKSHSDRSSGAAGTGFAGPDVGAGRVLQRWPGIGAGGKH